MTASSIPSTLPSSLQQTPDLDRWIRIEEDETITVFTGKVEIGQGIKTVIGQIAAEELDVDMRRMNVMLADTELSPDEGYTAGSTSTSVSGGAVRQAAAEVRWILVNMAATALDAPVERLTVEDGTVTDPDSGATISYWKLSAGRPLRQQASGQIQPKQPQEYKIVGQPVQRLDIPGKVQGLPVFVDDMQVPGMLHARVVTPPRYNAYLESVDVTSVESLEGVVQVVRNGSFLAVVAEREEQAVTAAAQLAENAVWLSPELPLSDDALMEHMLATEGQRFLVVDGTATDEPIPPLDEPDNAAKTVRATYYRPFLRHASLGPSSAMGHMQNGRLHLWTHSQGVYPLRHDIAQVLGMAEDEIRITHMEGPGCYGHNGADDAALDAALVACAVPDRPILLKWSRRDEMLWEPFGTAMVMEMQASLDSDGNLLDWNHETRSYSHFARPRPEKGVSSLASAWRLEQPLKQHSLGPSLGYHSGIHRNADPLYDFPQRRIIKHYLPDSPLRHSALRSLGAYSNIFASESFVDEVSVAAGVDPVEYRLRYMADERAKTVIEAAAEASHWRSQPRSYGKGQGFAFSQYKNSQIYSAVVAEVEVDTSSGEVRLIHCYAVADAGRIINPDGLSNQLQGGVTQAASWTLLEQVRFGPEGVQGTDWDSYPVMRIVDAPTVTVELLDRPDDPPLGAGEATVGPASAAIANAIYDAVGIRLRQTPFTPDRVLKALAASS